jgi:maternal embryonic leucine zipper kinase
MLQVDPKRRITVTQLLSHPWLMDGYDVPVKWQSKYHIKELDSSVIEAMAAYKLMSPAQVRLLMI